MAQLLVRNLKETVLTKLKQRASENGHSAEEEHRLILQQVLLDIPPDLTQISLKEYLVRDPMEMVEIPLPARNHPEERAAYSER